MELFCGCRAYAAVILSNGLNKLCCVRVRGHGKRQHAHTHMQSQHMSEDEPTAYWEGSVKVWALSFGSQAGQLLYILMRIMLDNNIMLLQSRCQKRWNA